MATLRTAFRLMSNLFRVAYICLSLLFHRLYKFIPPALRKTTGTTSNSSTKLRLSRPHSDLKPSYDVVVIGSGYGGGIAASRLARASPKQSVCVLERGKERWPGEFPGSARAAAAEMRVSGFLNLGHWLGNLALGLGKKDGLYQWIMGRATSFLVGNGLGGTSLVNANVFLRADERVLRSAEWPQELRDPAVFETFYQRAETMLEPTPYPKNFPSLRKLKLLRRQAEAVDIGHKFERVAQTVAFEDRINRAGVEMRSSTLSGQDCMGLNDRSKNSVLTTYLADAWSWGAEIFCGYEVTHVEKHNKEGYLVFYRHSSSSEPSWLHAKKFVFLGAGSIGTPEIMLRSREHGLPISPRAGYGLSGNGGFLSFGYDMNEVVNSLGTERPDEDPPGPTITGMIDCRDSEYLENGFVVQEGTFPTAAAALFRLIDIFLPTIPPRRRSGVVKRLKRAASAIFSHAGSALQRTQVYLTMGHDSSAGILTIQNDRPCIDMRAVSRPNQFERIKILLSAMTHKFGGVLKLAAFSVTVHPLGGMNMANDGTGRTGATLHTGEVFTGTGKEVHQGLTVVDGAAIPRSLGSNPMATISALAERSVELMAARAGLSINVDSSGSFQECRREQLAKQKPCVVFSETMSGCLDANGCRAEATLDITVQVARCDTGFEGPISGIMACKTLSSTPLKVHQGTFKAFQQDPEVCNQMLMSYELNLLSKEGEKLHLQGVKRVSPSAAFSPTRLSNATTTLYASMKRDDGSLLGLGVLQITPLGLIDMLASLSVRQARSLADEKEALLNFLTPFTKNLARTFFIPFAPLQYPSLPSNEPNQESRKPPPELTEVLTAGDGVRDATLRMWNPTSSSPNNKNILFVCGASVSHEIFALPTLYTNAIDHFTVRGYRCWILTPRFGKDASHSPCTAYDARLDIKAALEYIVPDTQGIPPYIIAHCVGSIALASGLLDGSIPRNHIAGLTASQIFMHPRFAPLNNFKARAHLTHMYTLLAGQWFDCAEPAENQLMIQRLLTTLLRFYPQSDRAEFCNSETCHRTQLAFGRCWNHANLSESTHARLHNVFGGIHTTCLQHLAASGLVGEVTDARGRGLVTKANLQRLKGLPIFLISGEESAVYEPSTTQKSYEALVSKFGCADVRRRVFSGLGHLDCWMSERAAEAGGVFASVDEEVGRVFSRID